MLNKAGCEVIKRVELGRYPVHFQPNALGLHGGVWSHAGDGHIFEDTTGIGAIHFRSEEHTSELQSP